MPSPFPGMDPFLEHPAIFPDLHDSLITYLREVVQSKLPEPYYASLGSRIWVETTQRLIGPDVKVLRQNGGLPARPEAAGGVAVATAPQTMPVIVHVPHDERRESFVEIYSQQDGGDRLVTSIEVLSPTNKTPGEHGRALYVQKQREILASQTHLVEIDLLRGGQHSTAVPFDRALEKTGPFDYHVCIHRYDQWEDFAVYPIRLEHRLPEIAIPLLPADSPIAIDMQALFDRCYDAGPYRRQVRYRQLALVPPLRDDQAEWATRLLREKGMLPP